MKLPQLDFPNQVLLQARRAPTINAICKRVKVLFRVCSDCQPLIVALIINRISHHSKADTLFHKVPCSYMVI